MNDRQPISNEKCRLVLPDGAGEVVCLKLVRSLPGKRQVYYGRWNERPLYAKIYQDVNRARVHWKRELDGLKALHAARIVAPEILYAGPIEGEDWLVILLSEISQAQSATDAWRTAANDTQRLRLMERVVDLVARHHQAGICQTDLHLDNLLLRRDEIVTLDGADIEVYVGESPKEQSLENLALLLAQNTPTYDSFTETLFERYQQARGWKTAEAVELFLERVRNRREKRRVAYLKKTLRNCTAFVCYQSADYQLVVDREFYSDEMRAFLRNPDSSCPEPDELLKGGNTSTVWRTDIDGQELVVKRYNVKSFWHGVKLSVRKGRSYISWQNAHRLRFYGIATPRPVVLYRNTRDRFRPTTYFITRYVKGADAREWFSDESRSAGQMLGMAEKIAAMLQQLEALWISHGDLKATNILIVDDEPQLIDLDSMRQHRSLKSLLPALKRDRERLMANWSHSPQIAAFFAATLPPINIE